MMLAMKFDSLQKAIRFAEKNVDRQNGAAIGTPYNSDEWYGNYGFEEFIHNFDNYSCKNKDETRLNTVIAHLNKLIDAKKHIFMPQQIFNEYTDMSGSYVNIDDYVSGKPQCMIEFDNNKVKPVISIAYHPGASAVDSNKIFMMGYIMAAIFSALKNRSINIYAVSNTSDKIFCMVPIITVNQSIIPSNLELVFLNAKAFFRRIFFAIEEGSPMNIREKVGIYKENGYGQPCKISKKNIKQHFDVHIDYIFNMDDLGDNDESSCHNFITKLEEAHMAQ